MILSKFMRGLEILRPHYEGGDGYHIAAEQGQFYAYKTNTPLDEAEAAEMKRLGWYQPEVPNGDPYDPEERWSART